MTKKLVSWVIHGQKWAKNQPKWDIRVIFEVWKGRIRSFLRSEVWPRDQILAQKNPAHKNLNPAKIELIPAQLGKFLGSKVGNSTHSTNSTQCKQCNRSLYFKVYRPNPDQFSQKSPYTDRSPEKRTSWPQGHPDKEKSFNLSPRDPGPLPLNAGQVWHLDLCVTLEV